MKNSKENNGRSLKKKFERLLKRSPVLALFFLLFSHLMFVVVLLVSIAAFPRFDVPIVYSVLSAWCVWMLYLGVPTFSYFFVKNPKE